jgi:putative membrane protein
MTLSATTRAALLAAAALLPVAACTPAEHAATTVQSAAEAQTTPTLSTTDTTFINMAAIAGNEEVIAGQFAQTRAASPAVRRFATRMVTDHTAIDQDLMALAQSKGITPTTAPDQARVDMMAQLQKLRGHAFDRTYMTGQVADHEAAVSLFQNEAQNGTDPAIKAFAAKELPTLQSHLEMARRLAPRPRS